MQIPLKPIKNKVEYGASVERLAELFHAKSDTPDGDELDVLMMLVEDYDRKHAPIPPLDPLDAIRAQMTELGLKQVFQLYATTLSDRKNVA